MPDPTPPEPPEAPAAPSAAQAVGHSLAAELHTMAVPADRPAATRDLIHEMVQAGAEAEITPDLLAQELPPEPFTEADYAAYEAAEDTDAAGNVG